MPRINYRQIMDDMSHIEDNFTSPLLIGILTLLVIFYSGFVAPYLPPQTASMVNSTLFRIAFLFLVLAVRWYHPLAALGILAAAFLGLTLAYFTSGPRTGPRPGSVAPQRPHPATASELEHQQMVRQLRRELEENGSNSDLQQESPVPTSGPFGTEPLTADESDSEDLEANADDGVDSPETEGTGTGNGTGTGGALNRIIETLVSCIKPKEDASGGNRPPYRVEHPDSPQHMSLNPNQPYGAYNSRLSNVDVDLKRLNPPFTVKNLPLCFSSNGTCTQPRNVQPHLATPHADTQPSLRPVRFTESERYFANKLNPPVEGFDGTDDLEDGGGACGTLTTCSNGGGSKKKKGGDDYLYSKNYHLTGGTNGATFDSINQELIHRKYAENETALNNIIQTNMGILISALIAELKYTLSEKEIRENLCDIIKTILKHRNTTLREFFNNEETYRSFVRLVLLVAEKVDNSVSMSIIHDVFSDVIKQMRHIVAEKLDTNVARRIGDISDIREKAKKVNLDQICNFPAETIGLNNGIQLYGGTDRNQCDTLPRSMTGRDPSHPDTENLQQVVSGNPRGRGRFFGPQGMLCPSGYPGVKLGAEFEQE